MRDGKNINKFALSHERVLISGHGNGRLRVVFTRSRELSEVPFLGVVPLGPEHDG
jgi:hypothetical protein